MGGPHPDRNRRNIVRTKFLGHICSHLVGASLLRAICRTGGVIGDAPIVGGINDQTTTVCYQERSGIISRLDILVNNAAKLVAAPSPGGFWEKPLEAGGLINVGLRSHFLCAYYA